MPGIEALTKIQMGRETTPGTAVAATTIWRGKGRLKDEREVVFPEENIGILPGTDRTYVPKKAGKISFDEVEATYEQLVHLFEAGIKAGTPVQDGTGSGYEHKYALPVNAQNTPKFYTLQGGDNQAAERMAYAFIEKLTLAGEASGALKMSADWIGREVVANAFTGSLAAPTVEEILFSKGKLYMDGAADTIGTTMLTNTWLDMSLELTTGFMPVFTANGSLDHSFVKQVAPELVVKLTFEHDAHSVAEKAAYRNQTPRQLRMLWEGSALGTPDSHATKKLVIDAAGKWESFEALGSRNGNNVVEGTFRARYNATAALFAEMLIVNELSAIP